MELTNKEAMVIAHLALGRKIQTNDKGKAVLYDRAGNVVRKVKGETIQQLEADDLIGPAVGDGFTCWFLNEGAITKRHIPRRPAATVLTDANGVPL